MDKAKLIRELESELERMRSKHMRGDELYFVPEELEVILTALKAPRPLAKLNNAITGVVARGMHYFENFEQVNNLKTASEVQEAIEGGVDRYESDPIYKAKVQSLVAQIMICVSNAR